MERKGKERKREERKSIYIYILMYFHGQGTVVSRERDRWSDFRAKGNERWTNECRNNFTSLLMAGFTRGA